MRHSPVPLTPAGFFLAALMGAAFAHASTPVSPEQGTGEQPPQSGQAGDGAEATPSSDAQSGGEVGEKADGKVEEPKEEAVVNARLAPGGVLGGGANTFPLRLTATLDTFVGSGVLQQSPGAKVIPIQGSNPLVVPAPNVGGEPQFGSSLSLRPSAMLPKLDWLPRMILSSSIDFSVSNWLPASSNTGVYERQIRVSDFAVGLILPGALRESTTGIVATPIMALRAPLSITSRMQHLITSATLAAQVSWSSPETPVGMFMIQYTPVLRGNVYAREAPTIPCEAGVNLAGVVSNPLQNGDLPVAYARQAEVADNGECILRGRQAMGSIASNGAATWIAGNHAVSLTLGHALGFLRPLDDRPDLQSQFATGQGFNETTNGSLSYTYTVPIDGQLFLTAGIASSQPAFTANNQLRFPFFDFFTPATNFAAAFFDVSVGI